jgi:prepilin-type processing-associated H-X9-DG protein
MKRISGPRKLSGFTIIDVLVVVATLGLLAVILPALARPRPINRGRMVCINNLRQIGLAFRMWSNDHDDRLPWQDTNVVATSLAPYEYFLAAKMELNSPKILVCPFDQDRTRTSIFDQSFSDQNVSYFLCLDADQTKPNTLLSGDRSLSTNEMILSGLRTLRDSKQVNWSPGIHEDGGNLGFADGSVQFVTSRSLPKMMNAGTIALPARLTFPR